MRTTSEEKAGSDHPGNVWVRNQEECMSSHPLRDPDEGLLPHPTYSRCPGWREPMGMEGSSSRAAKSFPDLKPMDSRVADSDDQ